MRGTVAKRIRKEIYGEEGSHRKRSYDFIRRIKKFLFTKDDGTKELRDKVTHQFFDKGDRGKYLKRKKEYIRGNV
jgi:hypothetical protein